MTRSFGTRSIALLKPTGTNTIKEERQRRDLPRQGAFIPEVHPCDDPATGPVVYYQVTQIAYNGGEEVGRPEEDDPDFFNKVEHMILKYTPSASRFFDWYLAGGLHRQYKASTEIVEIDTPEGRQEIEVVRPTKWDVYWETGIKLRATVPGKMRPFVLGYTIK